MHRRDVTWVGVAPVGCMDGVWPGWHQLGTQTMCGHSGASKVRGRGVAWVVRVGCIDIVCINILCIIHWLWIH